MLASHIAVPPNQPSPAANLSRSLETTDQTNQRPFPGFRLPLRADLTRLAFRDGEPTQQSLTMRV